MSKERMFKYLRVVFFVVGVLLVTVCIGPILTDSYEPNNTIDQAASVSLGSLQATVEPSDDEDYYKYVLTGTGSVEISYSIEVPAPLTAEISFFDSSKAFLETVRADSSGQTLSGTILAPVGGFYVRVRTADYSTSDTSYTLIVTQ